MFKTQEIDRSYLDKESGQKKNNWNKINNYSLLLRPKETAKG
jgi:hypothetical protein